MFRDFGHWPGIDLLTIGWSAAYHTHADNVHNVPWQTKARYGAHVLALTEEMARGLETQGRLLAESRSHF